MARRSPTIPPDLLDQLLDGSGVGFECCIAWMKLRDGDFTLACHCGTFRIADIELIDILPKHRPSGVTYCDTITYTTWTRYDVAREVDFVDEANIVNIDEINLSR